MADRRSLRRRTDQRGVILTVPERKKFVAVDADDSMLRIHEQNFAVAATHDHDVVALPLVAGGHHDAAVEGLDEGDELWPPSLYEEQLRRRGF